WLVEDVLPPEEERRRRLAPDHRRTLIAVGRGGPATAGAEEVGAPTPSTGPATPVERIVVALAEQLRDGDTAVLGSFTPIGYAAVLLAKHTHAPRLDFSAYGFGGTDIGWLGYLGVEGRA